MFSKQHYKWLARFAQEVPIHSRKKLAEALERDEPNFDRQRFEDDCGLTEYKAGVALLRRSTTP